MEQIRAVNALEPYILLSKSASPRAAADIITQATASPHTFVFAELLQTPNIQALRKSEYAKHLKLLEIFAWGTWADYQANEKELPSLSSLQQQKLQLLSLLPLARTHKPLTYATLQSSLSLSTTEELESLLTAAIYAELIDATLDPFHQVVHIDSVAPLRDVAPGSITNLSASFEEWSNKCQSMLSDIDKEKAAIIERAKVRGLRKERMEEMYEERLKADEKGKSAKNNQSDEMEVDRKGKPAIRRK
jgi:COP9 signalosome complex subunit 7